MKKIIHKLIPIAKLRHMYARRYLLDHGKNNRIQLVQEDGTIKNVKRIKGINIEFDGDNNLIQIHEPYIQLSITGKITDNTTIVIEPNCQIKLNVSKSFVKNVPTLIHIGRNFKATGRISVHCAHGSGDIIIGDNCLFSWGIEMMLGDFHTIVKNGTNEILNYNQSINIGNHVWIGAGVTILKGSQIPENCVVGTRSVIAKKFDEPNCVIAGIPARVVKKDINWDSRPNWRYELESRSL